MATDELTTDRPTSSTDWAEAFHNYQREEAAYASVAAEYEAACAEYESAWPDRTADFEPYGLSRFTDRKQDRDQLIRKTELRLVMRDYKGRDQLNPKELGALREEAARIVDDFLGWLEQWNVASLSIEPAEERHNEACDRLSDARNKLLNTPAPDTVAMLFKLDVLASLMAESCEQDAPAAALLSEDAHRLIGRA